MGAIDTVAARLGWLVPDGSWTPLAAAAARVAAVAPHPANRTSPTRTRTRVLLLFRGRTTSATAPSRGNPSGSRAAARRYLARWRGKVGGAGSTERHWAQCLVSLVQAQGCLRTGPDGMPDRVGETWRDVFDLDVQDVLVIDLEDLGDQSLTHRIGLAGVAIDFHSHRRPPFAGTLGVCT